MQWPLFSQIAACAVPLGPIWENNGHCMAIIVIILRITFLLQLYVNLHAENTSNFTTLKLEDWSGFDVDFALDSE